MPTELSHVTLATEDVATGLAFYDAALSSLGLSRLAEFGDEEEDGTDIEAAAWGIDRPLLWLVLGRPTQRVHVALTTESREAVDLFYAAALAAGGAGHAAPRRWVIYRRGRYGASVRDPDGNLVEVTAPE